MDYASRQSQCLEAMRGVLFCLKELQQPMIEVVTAFNSMWSNLLEAISSTGPRNFTKTTKAAVALLRVFLKEFDGSVALMGAINAFDARMITDALGDYLACPEQWGAIASDHTKPICAIVDRVVRRLSYCEVHFLVPSTEDNEFKELSQALYHIRAAFGAIYMLWPGLHGLYQELKLSNVGRELFKNPVYRSLVSFIPVACTMLDTATEKMKNHEVIKTISKELVRIVAYDETIREVDSSARFYLMNLGSVADKLVPTIESGESVGSGGVLTCVMRALLQLMFAAQKYENNLRMYRVRLFQKLGSEAYYNDFMKVREILELLGRVNGSKENNIVQAGMLAKELPNLANISQGIVDLRHLRGSPEELCDDSRNAAYIFWGAYVTKLSDSMLPKAQYSLSYGGSAITSTTAVPQLPCTTCTIFPVSVADECWVGNVFC